MRYLGLFFCLTALAAGAIEGDTRSYVDDKGAVAATTPVALSAAATTYLPARVAPEPLSQILWHYNIPDGGGGQRNTCCYGHDYDYILSGGWFQGFKMFETAGNGDPLWEWYEDGGEGHRGGFAPVGAEDADVFYGVWYNNFDTSLFRVYRFSHDSSSGPDWTFDAHASGYTSENMWSNDLRLDCTADGALLAVGVKHDGHPAVLFFGPDSSTPLGVWEDASNSFGPSKVRLSADGDVVVLRAGGSFYRVDTATATTVAQWDVGSNDGWSISSDAALMSYANAPLTVVQWNAMTQQYEELWQYQHPGTPLHYVGTSAFTDDGAELVVGWWEFDMNNMLQCFFTHHQIAGDGTPDWEYATPRGTDTEYQDRPVDCDISADGRIIAFATWGNADETHDEALVFDAENPGQPWFGIDHPGSCEHIQLSADGLLLASSGKTVHVNEMGSGGDVYSAEVDPPSAVEDVELAARAVDDGVLVAWTIHGETPARLRVLRGGEAPVDVSGSLAGRNTRWLDLEAAPGETYSYWIEVTDSGGETRLFGPVEARVPGETLATALAAPWPNPARDAFSTIVELSARTAVELALYDLAGRRVALLHSGELAAGRHEFSSSTDGLAGGVYLLRLEGAGDTLTRRLVVAH